MSKIYYKIVGNCNGKIVSFNDTNYYDGNRFCLEYGFDKYTHPIVKGWYQFVFDTLENALCYYKEFDDGYTFALYSCECERVIQNPEEFVCTLHPYYKMPRGTVFVEGVKLLEKIKTSGVK